MRNINELIGIIKGISYDGEINDSEVARLQEWVDRNRNLAYDKKQAELIQTIDTILDHIYINDNERELLLKLSDTLLNQYGDSFGRIHELYGVVDGIICDGKVNSEEIDRLKDWIKVNEAYLKSFNSGHVIVKIIRDLIHDGEISYDAQRTVLDSLTALVGEAQFESKLDYLCEQIRNWKNIGVDIIDLLDNEEAIKEIHYRAETQLINSFSSCSRTIINPEIVIVSLIIIAMLNYDGNYYEYVRKTYTKAYELESNKTETERLEFKYRCDFLPNMQLLTTNENSQKNDQLFDAWIANFYADPARRSALFDRNIIPEMENYGFEQFIAFLEARTELIKQRIRDAFPNSIEAINQRYGI